MNEEIFETTEQLQSALTNNTVHIKLKFNIQCCCGKIATRDYRYLQSKNFILPQLCKSCTAKLAASRVDVKLKKRNAMLNMSNEQKEQRKIKTRNTNLLKYGHEWSFQSDNNILKSKQTKLEKYGDENYNNSVKAEITKYGSREQHLQSIEQRKNEYKQFLNSDEHKTQVYKHRSERSKKCAHKAQQTKLQKYGSKNNIQKMIETNNNKYGGVGFQIQSTKDKFKQTMLSRYGVTHPAYANMCKRRIIRRRRYKF